MRFLLLLIPLFPWLSWPSATAKAEPSLLQRHAEYATVYETARHAMVAVSQKKNPRNVHPSFGGQVFSGVILSAEGHILTIAAAVERAGEPITVTLADQSLVPAELVNTDPYLGIALLKIQPPAGAALQPLVFGDSNALHVGDVVLSIGNAFGSQSQGGSPCCSAGILSGRYHPLTDAEGLHGELLETDAAVNPGSFGGALVNSRGELVGLLTDAVSRDRWLGLAIPTAPVRAVWEALLKPGTLFCPVSAPFALRNTDTAIVVASCQDPATMAGLNPGMTIHRIDGRAFSNAVLALEYISRLPGRSTLRLETRDGDTAKHLAIALPDHAVWEAPSMPAGGSPFQPGSLGCTVATQLDPENGIVIRALEPLGAAAKAGLLPGDVILNVNEVRVSCADALARLIPAMPVGTQIELTIQRDGKRMTFEARLRGKIT